MTLQHLTKQFLTAGSDFFFPPSCLVCQQSLEAASHRFCETCLTSLLVCVPQQRCLRCSAEVGPFLDTLRGCIHCQTDPYRFRQLFSFGSYLGKLRDACLMMKQPQGAPLAFEMTQLLCEMFGPDLLELELNYIVPVPHHWSDRLFQSHHPPDTIAQHLSRFLKVPVERHILKKIKRTPKQTRLSPSARRENLRNAFQTVSKMELKGKRILLVDDVLTTGTTANRVTHILKQSGAASVHVAVIARGIGA